MQNAVQGDARCRGMPRGGARIAPGRRWAWGGMASFVFLLLSVCLVEQCYRNSIVVRSASVVNIAIGRNNPVVVLLCIGRGGELRESVRVKELQNGMCGESRPGSNQISHLRYLQRHAILSTRKDMRVNFHG
jgi:hypothetical protein